MRDALSAMIKAYEIHGVLSSSKGIDKPDTALCGTFFVKVASTAVAAALLDATEEEIANAVSNAFVDGASLTIYRKGRHAGSRKNWAAGDSTSRGVALALVAKRGETGYPSALSAKTWGFNEVLFKGRPLKLAAPFASHVIEKIQFKLAYPAQRHTQTAAECAVRLHPQVRDRLDSIEKIVLRTHELCIEMVSVTGPLPTAAARDHCLQYVVAVALLHGDITSQSYEDAFAADPRIDMLRSKIIVEEEPRYTREYSDAAKLSNANAVQVFFADGSSTPKIEIEYPVGDAKRRTEGLPLLENKFRSALARAFGQKRQAAIAAVLADGHRLEAMPVNEFMELVARASPS
jgi:2-methylcitrate dehydratase